MAQQVKYFLSKSEDPQHPQTCWVGMATCLQSQHVGGETGEPRIKLDS